MGHIVKTKDGAKDVRYRFTLNICRNIETGGGHIANLHKNVSSTWVSQWPPVDLAPLKSEQTTTQCHRQLAE